MREKQVIHVVIKMCPLRPCRRALCWLSVQPSGWATDFWSLLRKMTTQYWLSPTFLIQLLCFLQWKNFGLALLFCILQVLSFTWWVSLHLVLSLWRILNCNINVFCLQVQSVVHPVSEVCHFYVWSNSRNSNCHLYRVGDLLDFAFQGCDT